MNALRLAVTTMIVVCLSGCEALKPPAPGADPDFAPTYPATPDPKELKRASGAIYSSETALPLFETPRARHPGDILTVLLVERTDAQKNASTIQKKNDEELVDNSIFLGRPINLGAGYNTNFDLSNQRKFTGDARAIQNNRLAGSISVTVTRLLPNGNMMVQGEKWVRINQGNEFVQLSGIVRPQDIKADNSITSDRVANARISYGATGQMNNTNAQGWFARILWSPLFPT
ncbi:flagellar basal body L-ring protein FlgH [Legionella worsleiensis]|uniref:Flagellar L-ring protein n=1 Tax=Legionella worsleiensis TaxID=45076 RepID=A0A0W1A5R9_9GAMM|nr:flagellar basal body L-ring protein FlgH [Legionella worsleiensis]KTD76676.1 flagellar basal body L-ring protein [Legionella worsleiensis]STY30423.1 flagellar L-ring protein FlgH [Legionella worsleiensis]